MKQHEYMIRVDKDVFEGESEASRIHYIIEASTNNHACYQELKDCIVAIVKKYEIKENQDGDQN